MSDATAASAPTRHLADFVARLTYEDLPERVRSRTKEIVLDAFASALAGHDASESPKVIEMAREMGASTEASVIGGGRLSMAGATIVNGYLITAVTVCDIHRPSMCHVTPEVISPALVTAEASASSGRDFLVAVAAGLEVTTRVGLGVEPRAFRARGWHSPGVTGPFGGAAAVGKLLGLDADRQNMAFGIAGSQSAGTYAQLGTSTIKFVQARGALSGLMAGRLARHDFSAASEILTNPDGGLFSAYAEGGDVDSLLAGLGEAWELMQMSLRAWPVAVHLQPVVTGLMKLMETGNLEPDKLANVRVFVSPTAYRMHAQVRWDDRFRARLSTPYVTAVVLHDHRCWLEQFTADRVGDPLLERFIAEKVRVTADPDLADGTCVIEIEDGTGQTLQERVFSAKGEPDNPLSREEIKAKLIAARRGIISEAAVERLAAMVWDIEDVRDVAVISNTLRATAPAASIHGGS